MMVFFFFLNSKEINYYSTSDVNINDPNRIDLKSLNGEYYRTKVCYL